MKYFVFSNKLKQFLALYCIITTTSNAFVILPQQHHRIILKQFQNRKHVTTTTTTTTLQTQLDAVRARQPIRRRAIFNFLRRIIFAAGAVETATTTTTTTTTAREAYATPTTGRIVELIVNNLDGIAGNKGSIYIQLHPEWAPRGVKRFEELTLERFWEGNKVYRVIPGYISQFGIHGNPTTQAKWRSNTISDDYATNTKITNRYGTLSFATSSTLGRTTQIFINTNRNGNQFLDDQGFLPIGQVIQGSMDVVERFYAGYGSCGGDTTCAADDEDQDEEEETATTISVSRTPNPGLIQLHGNSYLEREFPHLTYIQSASFVL